MRIQIVGIQALSGEIEAIAKQNTVSSDDNVPALSTKIQTFILIPVCCNDRMVSKDFMNFETVRLSRLMSLK